MALVHAEERAKKCSTVALAQRERPRCRAAAAGIGGRTGATRKHGDTMEDPEEISHECASRWYISSAFFLFCSFVVCVCLFWVCLH